jgi:hypothetical protein
MGLEHPIIKEVQAIRCGVPRRVVKVQTLLSLRETGDKIAGGTECVRCEAASDM